MIMVKNGAAAVGLLIGLLGVRVDAQITYSRNFALGEANSEVKAMLAWDPDGPGPLGERMFIGGSFSNAGGVPAAKIAQWDGVNWSALGTGMSGGDVFALAAFDDDGAGPNPERLYAAGTFSSAGGVTATRIARWDGSSWSALPGGGLNAQVNTLCVYNGKLYAGGFFTQANPMGTPVSAAGLASHDGTAWTGRSLSSTTVNALIVHDDGQGGGAQLYIGGTFTGAPGVANTGRIVRFNGTAFSAVGGGISGGSSPRVNAFAIYNGDLYAGGKFTTAGTLAAYRDIAQWNGLSWGTVQGGVADSDSTGLRSMAAYQPQGGVSRLYVSGLFTQVGTTPAQRIAAWSGIGWSALGSGLPASGASAMTVYPSTGTASALQVGGFRSQVGGGPAVNMGRWDGTRWNTLGGGFKSTIAGAAVRVIESRLVPQAPSERGDPISLRYAEEAGFGVSVPMSLGDATESSNLQIIIDVNGYFEGPNPQGLDYPPGASAGAVLDLEFTENGNIVFTGNFTQCGGQPAAGLGSWNRVTGVAGPFGVPGIVGGNAMGPCIFEVPSDTEGLDAFRMCTDAFEIGGQTSRGARRGSSTGRTPTTSPTGTSWHLRRTRSQGRRTAQSRRNARPSTPSSTT